MALECTFLTTFGWHPASLTASFTCVRLFCCQSSGTLTLSPSSSRCTLKFMRSSRVTSSFLYRIWKIRLNTPPSWTPALLKLHSPTRSKTDREEEKVDYSSAVHITASPERDCPLCEHQSTFSDASCRKRDVDVSFIFSLLFSDGIFWQRLAELWFEAFRIREEEKRQMKILALSESRAYTYTVIIYLNCSS